MQADAINANAMYLRIAVSSAKADTRGDRAVIGTKCSAPVRTANKAEVVAALGASVVVPEQSVEALGAEGPVRRAIVAAVAVLRLELLPRRGAIAGVEIDGDHACGD